MLMAEVQAPVGQEWQRWKITLPWLEPNLHTDTLGTSASSALVKGICTLERVGTPFHVSLEVEYGLLGIDTVVYCRDSAPTDRSQVVYWEMPWLPAHTRPRDRGYHMLQPLQDYSYYIPAGVYRKGWESTHIAQVRHLCRRNWHMLLFWGLCRCGNWCLLINFRHSTRKLYTATRERTFCAFPAVIMHFMDFIKFRISWTFQRHWECCMHAWTTLD